MPKCRDCKCLFYEPTCIRLGSRWTKRPGSENNDHDSQCFDPRETPLLVDALAKALRVIQDEDRLNELVALGRDNFNESMLVLLDRVFPEIEPALARYKEEVGDA